MGSTEGGGAVSVTVEEILRLDVIVTKAFKAAAACDDVAKMKRLADIGFMAMCQRQEKVQEHNRQIADGGTQV